MSERATMSDVHRFAWQGLHLVVPSEWDPVRLEGDFDRGYALLADLNRPRLGVRWEKLRAKDCDDPARAERAVDLAMRGEVGALAAAEARAVDKDDWQCARLFVEPDPPGRDVFIGLCPASRRLVQAVYHVEKPRRDRMLNDAIVPALRDDSQLDEQTWSVFELCCRVPGSMKLVSQRLVAGDLSLSFATSTAPSTELVVRQIAIAQLALQRTPIEQWLRREQATRSKHYRPLKDHVDAEITAAPGRTLKGVRGTMRRRRRFFFLRRLPESLVTLALHDEARDRLVIVQSSDEDLARRIAASVGPSDG
jgi:hypothetical protein